jgi:predicted enzyme related to lactoylglutathione lyase
MTSVITWHELITSDIGAATRFYTELLGLELETADIGDPESGRRRSPSGCASPASAIPNARLSA